MTGLRRVYIIARVELSPSQRQVISGEARGIRAASLRLVLSVLSVGYGVAVRVRNYVYDSGLRAQFPVHKPVISVGNLTAGGTGKTPAVEYLVKWLAARGARPGVLSRGYRSQGNRNDEALLLAGHLPNVPHRQRPSRYRAALEAIRLDGANVVVLDDGFQHRRLARFGDIVLVDATCPFGYGHLLPRGLLREPLRGVRRADLILVTRCDLAEPGQLDDLMKRLERLAPGVPIATSRHAVTGVRPFPNGAAQAASVLAGRRVGLFSSIGNPAAFRRTVQRLGAVIASCVEFPDHHWYTAEDVRAVVCARGQPPDAFVTTEKDAVKLGGVWPPETRLHVVCIEMELLSGEAELAKLLEEAVRASTYEPEADGA